MDTEAYFAAIQDGDVEGLKALIAAEPELLDALQSPERGGEQMEGGTGLHLAIYADQVEVAKALIEAGIDLEARTAGGRTALHDSIEFGVDPVTEALIARGVEVDICSAAILGKADRVAELLAADPGLANDRSTHLSPLGWAAFGNQTESARLLIEHGARMDDGELLCAASVGHVDVGQFLLDRGADPNEIIDDAGANALHAAAAMRYSFDSTDFVRLLLERGADVQTRTKDGRTALDIAEEYARRQADEAPERPKAYDAVAQILREHGS